MRNITISNIEITYPDATAYIGDNLFIALKSTYDLPVGAQIQVTDLASTKYRKLRYLSETSNVVFSLNDAIDSLYHDALSFNITIQLYENDVIVDSFGFDTDIMNGRTLPLRAHGSTQTVYVYDNEELYKVGFIFPASGSLSVNGHGVPIISAGYTSLDLRPYITAAGEYQLCFQAGAKGDNQSQTQSQSQAQAQNTISIVNVGGITPFSAIAQLYFADTSGDVPSGDTGGGVWNDDEFYFEKYCMTLVYDTVCDDYNFFEVRYYDSDGIMRYLGGKVVSETTESKGENFYRMDTSTPLRNISRRYLNEYSDSIKVAYGELRRDSYWNDILLADKVEFKNFNNEWVECSVKTSKVTVTSDETQDVELEYELLKK